MTVNDMVVCGDILLFGKWYHFLWPPVIFEMGFVSMTIRPNEFVTNVTMDEIMQIRLSSKI